MRTRHWFVAVVIVAATLRASAQDVAAPVRAPQPPRDTSGKAGYGTGTIRGRILDAATGRGVPRAEVRAGPNAPQFPDNRIVMTDADGTFEIKRLPADTYVINVSKPNYVRAAWGAQRVEGPGKRILLEEGQTIDKIEYASRAPASSSARSWTSSAIRSPMCS